MNFKHLDSISVSIPVNVLEDMLIICTSSLSVVISGHGRIHRPKFRHLAPLDNY